MWIPITYYNRLNNCLRSFPKLNNPDDAVTADTSTSSTITTTATITISTTIAAATTISTTDYTILLLLLLRKI